MDLLVELTVTDGCNRNCSYCFERGRKAGPDRFDEWKPVLAKLCRDFEAGKYPGRDRLLLTFWGGEPFLRFDRMLDVLDMTAGYGFVSYHVYTNATLKDQTEAFVADPRFKAAAGRFSAQVSYDGSPLNERSRGYGFDDIRGQALLLAGAGVDVSFKATVGYGDARLMPAAWDSYAALAAEWPGVKYAPTFDSVGDPSGVEEWPAVVKELCRREYAFYRRNGRFLMSWFDEDRPKSCRLRDRVFLHSDGVQYVCHGCPYSPDERFVTGSVESGEAAFTRSDGAGLPAGCAGCGATYCVYCNMAGMPPGRLGDAWNAGRASGAACGMYKVFGWHSRMLRYALLKGK